MSDTEQEGNGVTNTGPTAGSGDENVNPGNQNTPKNEPPKSQRKTRQNKSVRGIRRQTQLAEMTHGELIQLVNKQEAEITQHVRELATERNNVKMLDKKIKTVTTESKKHEVAWKKEKKMSQDRQNKLDQALTDIKDKDEIVGDLRDEIKEKETEITELKEMLEYEQECSKNLVNKCVDEAMTNEDRRFIMIIEQCHKTWWQLNPVFPQMGHGNFLW